MVEKIRFQTPWEARLKIALRELVEKAEELSEIHKGCKYHPKGFAEAITKAKEALGEKRSHGVLETPHR